MLKLPSRNTAAETNTVYLWYKGAYALAVLPDNSLFKLTQAGCWLLSQAPPIVLLYFCSHIKMHKSCTINLDILYQRILKHEWKIPCHPTREEVGTTPSDASYINTR